MYDEATDEWVLIGTNGLSMVQKYAKHGIKASHTSEVVLDDVRIPGRCLLGGNGYTLAYPAERWHRGPKIQQLVIARAIPGLRSGRHCWIALTNDAPTSVDGSRTIP